MFANLTPAHGFAFRTVSIAFRTLPSRTLCAIFFTSTTAAAVCVIHFASEHFSERPVPEAEVARNDTARALENYRAQRRDQPPREGAA